MQLNVDNKIKVERNKWQNDYLIVCLWSAMLLAWTVMVYNNIDNQLKVKVKVKN